MNQYPVRANIPHLVKILVENNSADPCTPIREYISNAHDAVVHLENPKISVWGEGNKLMIEDNGIGMTKTIILDAFTSIAGHMSQSDEEISIGMFGIGVLSAFMVARKLEVITKHSDDNHAWKLSWERNQDVFSLSATEKESNGTLVIFHLDEDSLDLARSEVLESYVKKIFALFPMPIFIGGSQSPVNPQSSILKQLNVLPGEAKIIRDPEIYRLFQMSTNLDLNSIYYALEEDGTHVFLSIPHKEHCPLDLHKVLFFSKGILVHGNTRNFFPTNLAFVIGLIDHPNFHLQISRESLFIQDNSFKKVKMSTESHIIRFLELIADYSKNLIEEVLHVHHSMLVAYANKNTRLRTLFKNHYRFFTSSGEIKWNELLLFSNIENGRKTIYVSSSEAVNTYVDLATASSKGFLTIYARESEQMILKQFADSEGVIIKDPSESFDDDTEVPQSFRSLANKLGRFFTQKGIRSVKFINQPEKREFPTLFRIRTGQGKLMISSNESSQAQNSYSIDSLMLNIANPLIRSLAGKKNLSDEMLTEVSDGLYQIAILNSPFFDLLISNNKSISKNIMQLMYKITNTRIKSKLNNGKAKCFVALPFNQDFNPVWESIHGILSQPPYFWEVVRGDYYIYGEVLLDSIRNHLKTSHRLIADISGLNANVLIELGLMLSEDNDPGSLLILCDDETYKQLPSDLGGVLLLTYQKKERENTERMQKWFAEKVIAYKEFISIVGLKDEE